MFINPSPAQLRGLAELQQEYQVASLSVLPADRATTEQCISRWYGRIGFDAPKFMWFDGPLTCLLACDLVELYDRRQLGSALTDRLRAEIHDLQTTLDAQVQRQFGALLAPFDWAVRGRQIGRELIGQIALINRTGRLWRQVDPRLGAANWDQFCRQFHASTGIQFSAMSIRAITLRDGFWAGQNQGVTARCAGYEYLGATPSAAVREAFREWDALQRACGWWFPFERVVICSERLQQLHLDAAHRPHNERGPVIECRDGLKVHAWHGVAIPQAWIDARADLDPWTALTWHNLEQRRVAAEMIGWAKVLELMPTRVVDADLDPQIGTLLECILPLVGPSRFLRVRCGTGREFVLSVPRTMATALQANAWTYGLTGDEYQLEARS